MVKHKLSSRTRRIWEHPNTDRVLSMRYCIYWYINDVRRAADTGNQTEDLIRATPGIFYASLFYYDVAAASCTRSRTGRTHLGNGSGCCSCCRCCSCRSLGISKAVAAGGALPLTCPKRWLWLCGHDCCCLLDGTRTMGAATAVAARLTRLMVLALAVPDDRITSQSKHCRSCYDTSETAEHTEAPCMKYSQKARGVFYRTDYLFSTGGAVLVQNGSTARIY